MNETIESILIGISLLSVLAVMALIVTASRYSVSSDRLERERFVVLFLAGVALQCIHFAEEFLTGFNLRFPELLGLTPWPGEFFVAFNVCWILDNLCRWTARRLPSRPVPSLVFRIRYDGKRRWPSASCSSLGWLLSGIADVSNSWNVGSLALVSSLGVDVPETDHTATFR